MKYLLIGIDGAHEDLFSRHSMPFLQSVVDTYQKPRLREDLISRGWVEIYSGEHALDNGGFYEHPLANSSFEWSKDCKLNDILDAGVRRPIWDVLNGRGYKVGVMNVPTTNPAPNIDGFFVSGGGGGRSVRSGVSEEQCWPMGVKNILDKIGYVVDERVPSLLWEQKIYDPSELFGRLKTMTERRVDAFLALSNDIEIDFGFIVFRSVAVTEYLACAEVCRATRGGGSVNTDLLAAIKDFYEHFDAQVQRLCSCTSAGKTAFVSDHSIVSREYSVNLNAFLQMFGFQESGAGYTGFLPRLKGYRHFLPYTLRKVLKRSQLIKKTYQSSVPFDKGRTEAFNVTQMGSMYGIYVNDKRFSGVVEDARYAEICEKIVSAFNGWRSAMSHGMSARLASEKSDRAFSHKYPDIIIDMPEGYVPDNQFNEFVTQYRPAQNRIALREVRDDNWTGVKGVTPLALFDRSQGAGAIEPLLAGRNLTAVYDVVGRELP